MAVLVVTGTGTGVGKTMVTAAVAALARAAGRPVALVKPAQTGLSAPEPGDVHIAGRLAGVTDLHEYARFPDPLSPAAAARRCGATPEPIGRVAERIAELAATRDVVVEGAGGLLVELDADGGTLADLAGRLAAPVLVVVAAGLGTLNTTALTLEALARRGVGCGGVVVGCWPRRPGLAARSNVADLQALAGGPLAGALAAGAGALAAGTGAPAAGAAADFLALAAAGLGPELGGQFDAADFTRRQAPPRRRATPPAPRKACP